MPRFVDGVVKFQNEIYPEKKELFEKLSQGQTPEALFITCSDSRIETAMITQTDPGELFICRNAGNIVPPYVNQTGGMTASIEFAMAVLKIPHIVICGHTGCGAMAGAMNPDGLEKLPHVKEWLDFSRAAVEIVNATAADKSEEERMNMLLEQNVTLQLRHIKTHPSVAVKLAENSVALHGWVYDIKTGAMRAYDKDQGAFVAFGALYGKELAYAKDLAHNLKPGCC